MALGISADAYANIGGLIAGLFVFVVLATSYSLFAQKSMIRSDYLVFPMIITLSLMICLATMVLYRAQFVTTVTV